MLTAIKDPISERNPRPLLIKRGGEKVRELVRKDRLPKYDPASENRAEDVPRYPASTDSHRTGGIPSACSSGGGLGESLLEEYTTGASCPKKSNHILPSRRWDLRSILIFHVEIFLFLLMQAALHGKDSRYKKRREIPLSLLSWDYKYRLRNLKWINLENRSSIAIFYYNYYYLLK